MLLLVLLVFILVLLVFLVNFLFDRICAYWVLRRTGFPIIPTTSWFYGHLQEIQHPRAPFHFSEFREKYGKTFGVIKGVKPVIITSDPKLIKAICRTNFGHFHSRMLEPTAPEPDYTEAVHVFGSRGYRWKRLRTVASAAVSTNNLKKLFPLVVETVDAFISNLESDPNKLSKVETHSLFQKLTSAVIGRCAYGLPKMDFAFDLEHFNLFRKAFGAQPTTSIDRIDTLEWCFPIMTRFYNSLRSTLTVKNISNPLNELNSYIGSLVSNRNPNEKRPDFLQFFKDAEDNEWAEWKMSNKGYAEMSKAQISPKMAPGEIVAQCRFLSIAGFDTTANSVTIFLYLLAKYPSVQEKIFKELQAIKTADYEGLQSLKYLHASLCEALRLFPHVSPLQHRTCMEGCVIGGHKFTNGLVVQFDTWSLHHDKELWGDDVEEFKPERFLASETLPEYWIPFGTGPRECIGRRFALMEEKIIAFKLLLKFEVRIADDWKNPELRLSLRNTGTIWPDEVWLCFDRRK